MITASAAAELGHLSLWLSLGLALCLGVVPMVGAARGHAAWTLSARPLTLALGVLLVLAYGGLTISFIANDFSVLYVAQHSNSALPLPYRIAGVWGGHEGSLLLWLLMLGGWMTAVALRSAHLPDEVVARILAVMGWVAVGFVSFTLFTSNPFERLLPAAPDGRDLNPLLQDPGMIFHPPMLYMGYVGFSVAFGFAVAALLGGQLDATWARWTRPWTVAAWACLTVGIALGSWWAYYELGWGGWWFWDPVENASFMPWLVGTALIHSLAVTEKRGAFKSWTVLLAIVAFSLSLLGTFLVRSGVVSSVHAFATDPTRGLFILGFLVLAVGASLTLYAWRAPSVGLGARFGALSRETALLGNNVMLVAACGAVLLGTLYPLALDALGQGKISVGPPYFDTVFAPLMAPLVFLMGVGPLARWKQATVPELWHRLRWAAMVAVVVALLHGWMAGAVTPWALLGLLLAWWVVASISTDVWMQLRQREGHAATGIGQRLREVPRATWGMWLAHLGVAVFIFGVTLVKALEVERDVQLEPGQSAEVAGLRFTLHGFREVDGPNYKGVQARVQVQRAKAVGGDHEAPTVAEMLPEKRVYRVQTTPMTEAAIEPGLWRDLYVSLGEPVKGGRAWIVRIYVKPMVGWIWGGCVIMALGGLLAVSDRRYRARRSARHTVEPETSPLSTAASHP